MTFLTKNIGGAASMHVADDMKYAFVTVVFEAEMELLLLQARSLDLYAPEQLVGEIIVINNETQPLQEDVRKTLLFSYGRHASVVRIIQASEITQVPFTNGWRSQQVLKLAVAEHIREPRYLILDAKTHLVYPLQRDFLEAADGRATVNVYSYEQHPLRASLERILQYLKLDAKQHVPRFTATVAPYVLLTDVARDLVRGIEKRSGRTFAQEFVRYEMTEFFLYSGWILSSGHSLEDLYFFHQRFCPIIWQHSCGAEACAKTIKTIERDQQPFLAVHRRAILSIDSAAIMVIATFWVERGLFGDVKSGVDFIERCKVRFAKRERLEKLRLVPVGVATVRRRLARRFLA